MSRLLAVLAILAVAGPVSAQTKEDLAAAAQKVLKTHCYVCHGQEGRAENGVYVLDRDKLVARRKVKPDQPDDSPLLTAMETRSMPPDGEKYQGTRPDAKEIAAVRTWIAAGAPAFADTNPKREFISNARIHEFILADLKQAGERDRRFYRYFTLTHLANAGKSEEELQSYRAGVSKLVNSLSWNRDVKIPEPIDSSKTILRIDIRDYEWTPATWDEILKHNPYGVTYPKSAVAKACYDYTQCPLPYVRGDWFVFAASKPPLYHNILELPAQVSKLEERLRIDRQKNIANDRVARAGFNGSGVSNNNRLIERHKSDFTGGAYWISYDFATRVKEKNLLAHPLDFKQDGGEVIFNLPNGLQAYLLIDQDGNRIDRGPIGIVSDPDQPDRTVINGISCMKCHADGMRVNADQVRDAVEAAVKANPAAFSADEIKTIRAIYPEKSAFDELLKKDAKRFQDAVKATGSHLSKTEPIYILARQFNSELDLAAAAAESGAKPDEFLKTLNGSPSLGRILGVLRIKGGTIGREVFVDAFGDIVKQLDADTVFQPGEIAKREPKAGEVRSFEIAKGVFMEFCWIPPGEAQLGSPKEEQDYMTKTFFDGKRPEFLDREIEAKRGKFKTNGFWLGKYTVTQSQWKALMGNNPSWYQSGGKLNDRVKRDGIADTSRFPVEGVSWIDSYKFLDKLNAGAGDIDKIVQFGSKDAQFVLPHENQWEYACRGGKGNTQPFYWGAALDGTQANCDGQHPYGMPLIKGPFLERPCAVDFTNGGKYEKNPWGLHHMAGNVWQWCRNGDEQPGPGETIARIVRGGGWYDWAWNCRASNRIVFSPDECFGSVGFRVAVVLWK